MLPSETKTAIYQLNVESDVSIAVAQVYSLPELKRVNQSERSIIATMVSELGTNVIKYAGSGTVRLRMDKDYNQLKVTLVAEDRGPGISDIDTVMKDHFSTGGTLGMGLPGLKRMSETLSIHRRVGGASALPQPSICHSPQYRRPPKHAPLRPHPSLPPPHWRPKPPGCTENAYGHFWVRIRLPTSRYAWSVPGDIYWPSLMFQGTVRSRQVWRKASRPNCCDWRGAG